jgi:hypothetical protein
MKEQTYQNPELVLTLFEEDVITSSNVQEDKSWSKKPWEEDV